MISLIIAEDHQALIDGIKSFLQYETDIALVGEANDGETLIKLVRLKQPQVVLTDIRMPKCDGITATKTITKEFPNTKVIAFSMFDQNKAIEEMKKAGASGYIMKNSSLKKVLEAIRIVAKNGTYFDNAINTSDKNSEVSVPLSRREREILRLIGDGKSSQEIADALSIGKSTVDTHRKNMLKKMKIQGKSDLIRYAVERKYDF